ncbi:MAG: alpha amylase N-terminal ig-like domain-containing protein [Lachnospiraceae bacterium]|nr:alpha amylase N-terminal ig-like domain-containing protein [Lachnospiraceae bacterium]
MNIDDRNKIQDRFQYILNMRPVLNKQALFSDTTQDYVTPAEPRFKEKVTVRFRTAKNNVDAVFLISGSKSVEMNKTEVDALFDYYSCVITMDERIIGYCFQIIAGKVMCYYNSRGISKDIQEYYNFRLIAGFRTPTWAKGAVMYQIYVDRFYNGDKSNDVLTNEYTYLDGYSEQVTDWDKYPAQMGVREFYGGDLQGVLDKMDYLEDLGIDVIYFNPLFVSPSNHKYDIQDYDYIDPHIGKIVDDEGELLKDGQKENRFATRYINRVTNKKNLEASNELFAKVVKEAHKRGMKVILDGVFNHCGSFNKWLDRERIYEEQEGYEKGAFISEKSPYKDYFRFHKDDCWPYNPSYDGWWGHDTLPKLNYEGSRELTDYIMKVGRKWVSAPYNADGWRLDVAADLGHSPEFNHRFWKEFRKSVKLANPNAVIIAEHYGYSREWLQGDEWDSVMNYDAFMEPVTWFLTGMQKHSDDYREDLLGNAESFWGAMTHHGTNFTNSSLQVSMNELSNHDHSRFLTRTNKKVGRLHTLGSKAAEEGVNKAVFREAVVMQMTWPGAPTIYYGDEAGVCGFTDPDNRRTYPWGHEDRELIEFHKQMIRVHKLNTVLLTGSLMNLGEDYNYVAYGRFDKEEQIVVVVNNNDHEIEKEVQTWRIGVPKNASMQRIAFTDQNGFSFNTVTIKAEDGKIKVKLPAESACVFKAIFTENGLKRTPVSDENMVDKVYPETVKEADTAKGKVEDKAESKAKKADAAEPVKEEKPEKKSAEKAEDAKAEGVKKDNGKAEGSKEGAKAEAAKDAAKADSAKDGAKADSKSDSAKDGVKAEAKSDSSKADGAKGDNAKAEASKSESKAEAKSEGKADAKQDNAKAEAKSEGKADAKDSAKAEGKADSDKKDAKDAAKDKAEKKSDDSKDKAAAKDAVKAEPDAKKEKASENKEKAAKAEPEEKQPKKSAWEVAEEVLGKPEDNKKSWFPFFK